MQEKTIIWIILFNLAIILSEVFFGLMSNSFALIADALHNAGDVIAVAITWLALRLGRTAPTYRRTFGYHKAEMMAAFVNSLFLVVTMVYLIYEALVRLAQPEPVNPGYMIVVGSVALVANGISAWLLGKMGVSHCHHEEEEHHHHHGHDHDDTNIRSAYLHMLSDALISAGVIVGGVAIWLWGVLWLDAALTVMFSLYILRHTWPLLRRSFLALMDIHSLDLPQQTLDEILAGHDEVVEYHDLHLATPSSRDRHISFHLVFRDAERPLVYLESIIKQIRHRLEHLGFTHIVIQHESLQYQTNHAYCTGAHHVSL